jgi:CO/xanthine dehydrogenase Mo-binding subunit
MTSNSIIRAGTIDFRKDLFADERDDNLNEVGQPTRRQDVTGHVTGRSPFYDDHLFEGLLHLRCTRSPHHSARIRRLDTRRAQAMPGVVRILTGADVPVNVNTLFSLLDFGIDDEPVLATDRVRYRGEPVAAVIAETEAQARDAAAAVEVEWEELPHVLDVEEAVAPGAPTVLDIYPTNKFIYHGKYDHQKIRFGDVEPAFARAAHVVEGRYQMSPIEQAPMETCGAIAAPEQNGRWVCYTSTQALFFSLGTAAKILAVPSSKLHFIGGTVGGGFGGKVDSIHEPLAILGAMKTGRPVKYMWDREEEMQVGAPRGAERWYIKDAVDNDGRILARKFTGYFDNGAYTRLSSYAIIKCAGHLPGPYTIPNVYADVFCVYTNRTPATAMRGFGITAVDFAIETHMDKVAETVGINPIDLRILNAYRDGDMKAHRRAAKNCALIECCQVVADKAGVTLSPASKAASSLTEGGGERGRLPSHTATDRTGEVQGYKPWSYARKANPASAKPAPPPPAYPQQVPVAPSRPAAAQPVPPPPPPPHEPPAAPSASRPGSMRFSTLSGFRRR